MTSLIKDTADDTSQWENKFGPPSAPQLNRGSYLSAHVLLNLLNKLGAWDKMRDLLSILSIFRNKFNKFNNTGAGMLDQ